MTTSSLAGAGAVQKRMHVQDIKYSMDRNEMLDYAVRGGKKAVEAAMRGKIGPDAERRQMVSNNIFLSLSLPSSSPHNFRKEHGP